MTFQKVSARIAEQEVSFETGKLAKQAHGAVIAQAGDTVVLATIVSAKDAKEGQDFFPLTVDYREKTYAAGKIPGGFFKREGKPSDREVLASRLIDRPMRPLFPEGYLCDTQVMVTVLSVDGEHDSEILAMNGAFAAAVISDVPFASIIGAVRVGMIEGEFKLNPSPKDMENSQLDLVLAGSQEKIIMIEAGSKEISEEEMLKAIQFGHQGIRQVITLQKELQRKAGKPKRAVVPLPIPKEWYEKVRQTAKGQFVKIFECGSKEEREAATKQLYKKCLGQFDENADDFNEGYFKMVFDKIEQENVREYIVKAGKRPDGRKITEIRPISCEIAVLPRTHGSAVFTRGQTQSLSVATLGTGQDQQMIDSLTGETWKSFMLHYNFPSFSVGETKSNRGPGRREIGHGALAERSLEAVLPSQEDFPYTIRLVSEILESNGSSSMATVCAGTLALMDAGVPLKAPVAGIALGLIADGDKWQVLTDIQGIEDHHGDMDFKAAGTEKGLTALQMDLKIDGVTEDMMKEAFRQAKDARFKILGIIKNTISEPRKEMSAYAPRITKIKIDPSKIGELIGPGGKNIKKLVEETGAKIDIEDDGTVCVASTDQEASKAALERIRGMFEAPEIGRIYESTVKKLVAFGAFCEILPGKDGLLHVSEVAEGFVKSITDYLRVGDKVSVKVVSVDDNGKVSLSVKQAQEGGLPVLPPDAERDVISESGRGGGRDRDRGSRSRRR